MRFAGRSSAAAAGVLVAVGLVSGCLGIGGDPDAGTNGVGKLPPAAIEAKAVAAARTAAAVHLAGTVVSNGRRYRLDMRLRGNGGVGEVTCQGSTFQLLRVGSALYLKANADFYASSGSKDASAAADELSGKYVKVPPGDPAYAQFSGFTDKKVLLSGLFVLDGAPTLGPHRKVDGARTVAVDGEKGGSLDVALDGDPYPLRYRRAGGSGTLTLSDWNDDFSLAAPGRSAVVDYGKALGRS